MCLDDATKLQRQVIVPMNVPVDVDDDEDDVDKLIALAANIIRT